MLGEHPPPRRRPRTTGSPPAWSTTPLGPAHVVASVLDGPTGFDPEHPRNWVAANHQIDRIQAKASARGVVVPIVVDLIHDFEYLWGAAWCFFAKADPDAETWVRERARPRPSCKATPSRSPQTSGDERAPPNSPTPTCQGGRGAKCLVNKANYLDYPTALAAGWPIDTAIIEGACRHLVANRMNIIGARCGVTGAEAVLKLRRSSQRRPRHPPVVPPRPRT